jgi:serine/threonine protein kinase
MNCWLQIAVGLNYIHKRGYVHQSLIPDNIYVENDRILKIGNMCHANLVMSKIAKNFCVGGSPEYWSHEQGSMYTSLQERAKEGAYTQSMKLLPVVTNKSDIYQMGLILAEMLFSRRLWARGDRLSYGELHARVAESQCNKETTAFVLDKIM